MGARILFGLRYRLGRQSYKREFLGFVVAYLISNPLSRLLAVASIAIFPSANDLWASLIVVLMITISSGIPAGWFWTKMIR
jgi:hypothetical protein